MSMETTVYRAGPPHVGEWVLRWRTATMPWPAFDYFPTREAAEARGREMRQAEAENRPLQKTGPQDA